MFDWLGPAKDIVYLAGVIIVVSGVIYKIRRDMERSAENIKTTQSIGDQLSSMHTDVTGKFEAVHRDIQEFQQETRLTTQQNVLRIEQQEKNLQHHLDECREDKKDLRKDLDTQFNRLHEKINKQ
jgi:chromosome segregation ATPase